MVKPSPAQPVMNIIEGGAFRPWDSPPPWPWPPMMRTTNCYPRTMMRLSPAGTSRTGLPPPGLSFLPAVLSILNSTRKSRREKKGEFWCVRIEFPPRVAFLGQCATCRRVRPWRQPRHDRGGLGVGRRHVGDAHARRGVRPEEVAATAPNLRLRGILMTVHN